MGTNSEPTLYAITNACCCSICSIYPAAVRLPRTTTRSVRPSLLMPPHTITEPCPNRPPSCKTFGLYCSPRRLHRRWRPSRSVMGNLVSSLNNIGEVSSWRGYGQTQCELRDVAALNGLLEQDVWVVRTLLLTCSLLSGQTLWLQWPSWGLVLQFSGSWWTTPQFTDGQISGVVWGFHASITLSNQPCELACRIVAIPQAVNNWRRAIETHSNTTESRSFLAKKWHSCDLHLVKIFHGMYWYTYNVLKWPHNDSLRHGRLTV